MDDALIFGRYTREECGLPPVNSGGGARRFVVRALLLLAALVTVGWIAGRLEAGWREAWLSGLPAMVHAAPDEDVSDLLARGRMYASALPARQRMRRDLALAVLVAGERAPRREGYYANARRLLASVRISELQAPEEKLYTEFAASGVHAQFHDYAPALACLERADKALEGVSDAGLRASLRLLLVNAHAYYLAVAPRGAGGDPARSLELAQLMIASRDTLPGGGYASDSAAFLDTLAMAWHVNGDADKALASQSMALGLADSSELFELLTHYDEIAGGAAPSR